MSDPFHIIVHVIILSIVNIKILISAAFTVNRNSIYTSYGKSFCALWVINSISLTNCPFLATNVVIAFLSRVDEVVTQTGGVQTIREIWAVDAPFQSSRYSETVVQTLWYIYIYIYLMTLCRGHHTSSLLISNVWRQFHHVEWWSVVLSHTGLMNRRGCFWQPAVTVVLKSVRWTHEAFAIISHSAVLSLPSGHLAEAQWELT